VRASGESKNGASKKECASENRMSKYQDGKEKKAITQARDQPQKKE